MSPGEFSSTMRSIAIAVAVGQLMGAVLTFPMMRGRRIGLSSLFAIAFVAVLSGIQTSSLFVPGAIPGAFGLGIAVVIFLWARITIRGLRFSAINSKDVPQFVCSKGPYHWIRHPFYTSYLSTLLSMAIMFPNPITIGGGVMAVVAFNSAAAYEENKFKASPVAGEYQAYKQRTGRFVPRFNR